MTSANQLVAVVSRSGIDGLIKVLDEKNRALAKS